MTSPTVAPSTSTSDFPPVRVRRVVGTRTFTLMSLGGCAPGPHRRPAPWRSLSAMRSLCSLTDRTITPLRWVTFRVVGNVPACDRCLRSWLRTTTPTSTFASLLAAKDDHVVSVCLPARNEASTVGRHRPVGQGAARRRLRARRRDHRRRRPLERRDRRGRGASGARVVGSRRRASEHGDGHGKGAAMWKSLAEAEGDLIVWCDADVIGFEPHFVTGLLGPLLTRPENRVREGLLRTPRTRVRRSGRTGDRARGPSDAGVAVSRTSAR